MKRFLILLLTFATALCVQMKADTTEQTGIDLLLPTPHSVQRGGSSFALNRPVQIVNPDISDCDLLSEILTTELGCTITPDATATVTVTKVASVDGADEPTLADFEPEAYKLTIDGDNITIEAVSRVGVIRAAQTLQQLAEVSEVGAHASALEGCIITDWPAFKVRGFMHDVGRSFITIDELEKEIKLYSRFKVNVFQWHMTENQAWRFEVKNTADNASIGFDFSKLTDSQYMTRFPGQYYSQEDCRRLDAIAHKYGVYIIPELDMPGHSGAFTRATGHNMQSDEGIAILSEALKQCCDVFLHSPYIHIGGDEVAITYNNFLNIMSDVVRDKGRKTVWWNTCAGVGTSHKLVDPSTDHCDMAQCWASSGVKVSGVPSIDCRYNYTNHFDVFADLVGMYRSNILGDQNGKSGTAGFISCPWNDRKTATQTDIIKQNNVYAVTIASGERAWLGGGRHYITDAEGGAYLPNDGDDYNDFCDWERRFLFHKAHSLRNEPIPYVKQTNVRWRVSSPVSNGGDANTTFAEWEDHKGLDQDMPSIVTRGGQNYGWTLATGAGIYLNHTWGSSVVPGIWGKKNQGFGQTAYAYTYIYNEGEERTVGAQIEFQNYGRSENDAAPVNGTWDRKGSNIWWNGTAITPPEWLNNGGGGGNSEALLQNENFPARTPIELTLKAGWNKVFIKLPYVDTSCRLDKWLYTFVLTDLTGTNAIDGITYSPYKTLGGEDAENALGAIDALEAQVVAPLGEGLGYYPESVAVDVRAQLAAYRQAAAEEGADLAQILLDAQRAYNNYTMALYNEEVNMPATNNADDATNHWYTIKDKRGNKYAAANGVAAGMTGSTTLATDGSAYWKIVDLGDGRVNFVNYKYGCYITNTAGGGAQLTTAATAPSTGWTISYAETPGYFIISNGGAQLHQGTGANVLNWGGGSKKDDDGCLFLLTEVTGLDEPVAAFRVESNLSVGGVSYTSEASTGDNSSVTNGQLISSSATTISDSEVKALKLLGYDGVVTIDNDAKIVKVVYTLKEGEYYIKAAFNNGERYAMTSNGTALRITTADATPEVFKIRPTGNINSVVKQPTYYITNAAGTSYMTYGAGLGSQTEVLLLDNTATGVTWENATPAAGFFGIDPISGVSVRSLAAQPTKNVNYGTRTLPTAYYAQSATSTWTYSWVIENVNGVGYAINCTGLADGVKGGVTYNCVNYTDNLAVVEVDRDALIAMHVSGYNGRIESIDEEHQTINVVYDQNNTETSVLWDGNGDVNNTKLPAARIPAMVKAHNGDILAFSDWRYSRDDVGRNTFSLGYQVDIEMRRSTDGGRTWSPAIIAANGDGTSDRTTAGYGDASVVADSETDNVLLMCVNAAASNRFVRFTSSDNGATWSGPTNIAAAIGEVAPGCTFFTSGKMVQSRDFKKEGSTFKRIYAPLCGGTADYVLYSDDFGQNWHRLGEGAAQTGTNNECRLVELPNGDILLDSRDGGARRINVFTYTDRAAGTGSWGEQDQAGNMPTVDCNGDIDLVTAYPAGSDQPVKLLLETMPRGGNNGATRAHVQYYYKVLTEGQYTLNDLKNGWEAGYEVCAGKSAYSSIIDLGNGSMAILYEKAHAESETGYNGNPWGYDIKFETHDLAEITKNNYYATSEAATTLKTIHYTLTDAAGNSHTGTYEGRQGAEPALTGSNYTLNNKQWGTQGDDLTFTADIAFPFTVSSASDKHYVHITGFRGYADKFYWYANDNTYLYVTKNAVPGENTQYDWAIIPTLTDGKFTFTLLNRKYQKYISTTSTTNSHTAGVVKLSDEGTVFTYDDNGFATTLSSVRYISVNSSGTAGEQAVGTNTSHAGTKVSFEDCTVQDSPTPTAGRVVATQKTLVAAANPATPVESTTWTSSEDGGKVYSYNGSNQYFGAIENADVTNALKGDKIVTVAAWVYGVPTSDQCIFGYGENATGIKFMLRSGPKMKTTTKDKKDFDEQTVTGMQANQWNLVAFAFPGKTSSVNDLRYYTTATDETFWVKSAVTANQMKAVAAEKVAVGSGDQDRWREGFNGLMSNLTVIESDDFLNNSAIAGLVGEAPAENPFPTKMTLRNKLHNYLLGHNNSVVLGTTGETTAWEFIPTADGKYMLKNGSYYIKQMPGGHNAECAVTTDVNLADKYEVTKSGEYYTFKVSTTDEIDGSHMYMHGVNWDNGARTRIVRWGADAEASLWTLTPYEEPLQVMPVEGKTYYIYSDNKATTTGGASAADAQYYLYYNGSNLGLTATKVENTAYMWTCAKVGEKYTFRNVQTGTYMGFKAMSSTAYQFTVSTSNAYTDGCVTLYGTNKYLVIPNGGTGFDQADGTYNKGTTNFSTDFVFEECDPNDIYFSADFEHAKWLRIINAQHTGYAMTSKGAGAVNGTAQTDASLATQLYAFVGDNTNGFYIYNKQLGADYKLTATATSDGTDATWTQGEAAKWYLDAQYTNASSNAGFVITTQSGTSTKGLNIWAGAGGDTKFWDASGAGSHWNLSAVESEPTIIHYAINGTKKHNDANPYMGRLSIQGGSFNSQTFITAEYKDRVVNAYMPKGTTSLTFTNYPFHGWTYSYEVRDGQHYVTYTADQDTEYQYLWMSTGAAHPYRIPAIATLKNGNIIAVNDYRPCGGDIGNGKVDLVKRISADNGHTWSTGETIIEGNTSNSTNHDDGFGDPAIVVDSESGRVLLMCVTGRKVCTSATREDPNRVARFYSNDNGQTFTGLNGTDAYDDITEAVYSLWDGDSSDSYTMQSIFIGSGRIFQSRTYKKPGSQYYRLYAALWSKDMHNRVMYSDDFGETWHILGDRTAMPFPNFGNANEPKCEELPDGSVIMSSRKPYGRYYNIFTYTNAETGEGSWGTAANSNISTGDGNGTNGEIMVLQATRTSDNSPRTIAIQSLPQGPARSHLVFYYKDITEASAYQTDGVNSGTAFAANWTKGMEVTGNDAGYSTFTIQTDQRFGLFYEEGPAGYEMVYVPLTLEDITSGAYTFTVPADYIKAYSSMKAAHSDKSQVNVSDDADWLDYVVANPAALTEALADADPYAARSVVELYNGGTPVITIASLDDLTAALNAIQMVQKYRKGCFVRIQGYSGNYISGNAISGDSNAAMSPAQDKTTIFYLAPTGELINYGTGQGIVNTHSIGDTGSTLNQFTVKAGVQQGKYQIVSNATGIGTYLYDNTANSNKLDRNTTPVTSGSYQTDWTLTEVKSLPVNVVTTLSSSNEVRYNTLCSPVALNVPAGVNAYVCRLDDSVIRLFNVIHDENDQPIIPANTGVLLYAPAGSSVREGQAVGFPVTSFNDSYEDNGFEGVIRTTTPDYDALNWYSLQRVSNGQVGFYEKSSGNLAGFHAYVSAEKSSGVRMFTFEMGEGETESIETQELLRQLNAPTYDLSGRMISEPTQRGLYIIGGKKVIK